MDVQTAAEAAAWIVGAACAYILLCVVRGMIFGHDPTDLSSWTPWCWKRNPEQARYAAASRELDEIRRNAAEGLRRQEARERAQKIAGGQKAEAPAGADSVYREWNRLMNGFVRGVRRTGSRPEDRRG